MKHWSVDVEELKKDKDAYAIWSLEQAINFGISQGKINTTQLKKYWNRLDLDSKKKKFMELLLAQ